MCSLHPKLSKSSHSDLFFSFPEFSAQTLQQSAMDPTFPSLLFQHNRETRKYPSEKNPAPYPKCHTPDPKFAFHNGFLRLFYMSSHNRSQHYQHYKLVF